MIPKPLILVCNDDGIFAPGIRALIDVVKKFGEIVVVAPDKPQSGKGMAITINSPLRYYKVDLTEGVLSYACDGTPVDCIKLAINKILPRKPDLIVSGINHGANSSINVIYSGTMSAALEGAMEKVPSVGFSLLDHSIDANFEPSKKYVEMICKKADLSKGAFFYHFKTRDDLLKELLSTLVAKSSVDVTAPASISERKASASSMGFRSLRCRFSRV